MTFYKGSLIKRASGPDGKGAPEPTARLLEVGEFIEKTARKGKTLVVTNKPVRCALTAENERGSLQISAQYRGADIAHFGNLRGSNEFEVSRLLPGGCRLTRAPNRRKPDPSPTASHTAPESGRSAMR
jgi:hypothetical protein